MENSILHQGGDNRYVLQAAKTGAFIEVNIKKSLKQLKYVYHGIKYAVFLLVDPHDAYVFDTL